MSDEALQYIHAVCWKGSVPGLERITELMQRLGNPEKELKFIHIVGTNGKGSTAAMLASVLKEAGYRTGLFTSPYVVDFRERMQMDGEMIPPEELAAETEAVKPFAAAMADAPTEFELITAIALRWFARRGAQIVVLEAGMGGALDSTNVIPAPEAAVFTNTGSHRVPRRHRGGDCSHQSRNSQARLRRRPVSQRACRLQDHRGFVPVDAHSPLPRRPAGAGSPGA